MHATLDRTGGAEGEALFFSELPDPASEQRLIREAEPPQRSSYGAARRPNWPAILAIAALHAVALVALVKFDVIQIHRKAPPLKVFNIVEIAPPPPLVELPKPKAKVEPMVPQVVTP